MNRNCIICADDLETVSCNLPMVFSDCRPMDFRPSIGFCVRCGHVQKVHTRTEQAEIESKYSSYEIYHQGSGEEQIVSAGVPEDKGFNVGRRSDLIALSVKSELEKRIKPSREPNCILDFGCATGNLLQSLRVLLPDVSRYPLVGVDVNPSFRSSLERVDGAKFFTALDDVECRKFSCISVIHTLEHMRNPIELLVKLKEKLADNGFLFVQVPNSRVSLFDLVIADHVSHFTEEALRFLFSCAGFSIELVLSISREFSIIATPKRSIEHDLLCSSNDRQGQVSWVRTNIQKLDNVDKIASNLESFAVFGSSIAASWLISKFDRKLEVLLDEDNARWGHSFRNKSIIRPSDVRLGLPILFPFDRRATQNLIERNPNLTLNRCEVLV